MMRLNTFEKFNRKFSMSIEWVGLAALLLMMLITTIDIIGAKMFRVPIFGVLDAMMILQLVGMSFGVASALVLGRHVQVEFFVMMLPKRIQAAVDCIINLLGFVLFVLIVWRLGVYAHGLQIDGEVSSTARIPLYPFVYGAAFACTPVCLIYATTFVKAVPKVFKNGS